MANRICTVEDCKKKILAKGYCSSHYQYNRINGTPVNPRPRELHGMWGTPVYMAWNGMISRCHNPKNPGYKWYGKKGRIVCKEWRDSFLAFYKYMGDRPYKGASIDRIDNDGNYEPGNVRWTDRTVQAINKGMLANNTSGYKGVRRFTRDDKWAVSIGLKKLDGGKIHLGYFSDKEKAALAYNKAALKYHGAEAKLNIIRGEE